MHILRKDHEPPPCTFAWKWKFHHTGIPTAEQREDEKYIPHLKMYVSGFDTSSFGIEWMRFEPDSPVHPLVQKIPHIAFEVTDIHDAIHGFDLLSDISSPSPGVKVAMIKHNGAPVELIQFTTSGS